MFIKKTRAYDINLPLHFDDKVVRLQTSAKIVLEWFTIKKFKKG